MAGPIVAMPVAMVAPPVLGVETEIRVSGTVLVAEVVVIAAALVAVAKDDAEGSAVGDALENAGPDFRQVFFLALGNELGLTGAAAAEVGQEVLDAERHSGRTAVDDDDVTRPVADAGGGDAEQLSEGIACHRGFLLSVGELRMSSPRVCWRCSPSRGRWLPWLARA